MKYKTKISKVLDLPREVLDNIPFISITGFDDISIENYKGIIEYTDYYIKLATNLGNISINGNLLKLEKLSDNKIVVTGKILNISFENSEV